MYAGGDDELTTLPGAEELALSADLPQGLLRAIVQLIFQDVGQRRFPHENWNPGAV
jgi:hypothetical protein